MQKPQFLDTNFHLLINELPFIKLISYIKVGVFLFWLSILNFNVRCFVIYFVKANITRDSKVTMLDFYVNTNLPSGK